MSHILDALRRAEDERRLGKPPDRGMIAGPLRSSTRRRGSRHWLLLGALLLAAAALLLTYRQLGPQPASAPSEASAPQPAPSPPPAPVAEAPAVPPPSEAPDAATAARELPRARVGKARRIESLDALFAADPATPEARRTPPGDSSAGLRTRDAFQTVPDDTPQAQSAAPETTTPDTTSDLPSARSAGVPEFTIQVHAWAPEAGDRFIRVDGRRLSEGDSLPNGARIARIARDGVVLEWRGQRLMRRLGR